MHDHLKAGQAAFVVLSGSTEVLVHNQIKKNSYETATKYKWVTHLYSLSISNTRMTVLGRSKHALFTFKPVFNSTMYMEIEFLFKHLMPSFCQKKHKNWHCNIQNIIVFMFFVNNFSYFIWLHLLLVCGCIFSSHVMLTWITQDFGPPHCGDGKCYKLSTSTLTASFSKWVTFIF